MELFFVYGYLGSGKTTFVKNFLEQTKNKRVAVVVNDFGENDVDGVALMRYAATLSPISGGSIFCSCKSDKFVETIIKLSAGDYDIILVETSGLANPFMLKNMLPLIEKKSKKAITLGLCYCLVDLMSVEKLLPTISMMKMQIASSDVVLLNKSDLVTLSDGQRVEKLVREINKNALVLSTCFSACDNALDFKKVDKELPSFITDINTQKITIRVRETEIGKLNSFCKLLSDFCHRIKGVVKIEGRSRVYQYMYGKAEITECETKNVESEKEEVGFLVALSCSKVPLKKEALKLSDEFDFIEEIL